MLYSSGILIFTDSQLSKRTENKNYHLPSYKECIKLIVCDESHEECYFTSCNQCPGVEKLKLYLEEIFENSTEKIQYKQWVLQPRATLESLTNDACEFVETFCEKVSEILPHAFIAAKQSQYSRLVKEKLLLGEFIVLADFAENYAFNVQNAAPGFHWNNDQATIYNVVVYFKGDDSSNHCSIAVISDCLHHDAVSVYAYHNIVIKYLKEKFDTVNKIYYFTDGAPQQYKNYKNVINLANHKNDYGVNAEWHFFPTAHGKGPCDGLGATVKRSAVRASLQSTNVILTANDLFKWLKDTPRLPNIHFEYLDLKVYDLMKKKLNKRFTNNCRIKSLQQKHCLILLENGNVRAKTYSESEFYKDFKIL